MVHGEATLSNLSIACVQICVPFGSKKSPLPEAAPGRIVLRVEANRGGAQPSNLYLSLRQFAISRNSAKLWWRFPNEKDLGNNSVENAPLPQTADLRFADPCFGTLYLVSRRDSPAAARDGIPDTPLTIPCGGRHGPRLTSRAVLSALLLNAHPAAAQALINRTGRLG